MPQSTNVLSFISPHSGEATSRKGSLDPIRPQESGEDVLRRIAEAAVSATGASGAALALQESGTQAEGIFVCVAHAGEMAPPIGAKLDSRSGISGECLRTGQALHCEDTETDARVDRQACRALGLRSLAIAPVKRGDEVVGILEVFSVRAEAFTGRHLDVLGQLTELVLDDSDSASEDKHNSAANTVENRSAPTLVPPTLTQHLAAPILETDSPQVAAEDDTPKPERAIEARLASDYAASRARFEATPTPNDVNIAAYMAAEEAAHARGKPRTPFVFLIGLAIVLAASTVCLLVWRYMAEQAPDVAGRQSTQNAAISSTAPPLPATPAAATVDPHSLKPDAGTPRGQDASRVQVADARSGKAPLTKAAARDVIRRSSDLGGDTSDVTRPIRVVNAGQRPSDSDTPPALESPSQSGQVLTSLLNAPASLPQLPVAISQGVQGGELERRVEPIYPAQAKTLRQQGIVVLQAFVTETGAIRDVRIVSGPPMLGQAAAQAVRQWKYKPFQLNGKPVAVETQVKVAFKLP